MPGQVTRPPANTTNNISAAGAPARFQARVGKHMFDKIRREAPKNFFRLPTLVSSLPTLPYVAVAHPAHRIHWYRHRVWRDNLVWLRYEKLPTLTVLPAIALQPQYFAAENYLTLNKCSFYINKLYGALSTTERQALRCL